MELELEKLLLIGQARTAMLMQLVRMLFRDRAEARGQSSDDILRWSEDLKRFFENQMKEAPGAPDAYMTAVIDDFCNFLAGEVRSDRKE